MAHGRLEPLEHYIRVDMFTDDGETLFEISCRLCPYQELTDDKMLAAIWATSHADYHRRHPQRKHNPGKGEDNAAK